MQSVCQTVFYHLYGVETGFAAHAFLTPYECILFITQKIGQFDL